MMEDIQRNDKKLREKSGKSKKEDVDDY